MLYTDQVMPYELYEFVLQYTYVHNIQGQNFFVTSRISICM